MNSVAVASRVRQLRARHPYMSPLDVAKLTGFSPGEVRAAWDQPARVRRIEARGPLSAAQVVKKTGSPLSTVAAILSTVPRQRIGA